MTLVPREYYRIKELINEINYRCKFPHPVSCRWSPVAQAAILEVRGEDAFISHAVSIILYATHRSIRHHLFMVASSMMDELKKKDDDNEDR